MQSEVHEAIEDVVKATGGNYDLAMDFYFKVHDESVAFDLKSVPAAALYEETWFRKQVSLSDAMWGGKYPEARASVLIHECTHVKHGRAWVTNEWVEGESYALDLFLAEKLSEHFSSGSRNELEKGRCATIRKFEKNDNFHRRPFGAYRLAVSNHYVIYGVYRILDELRQGRVTHFVAAVRPETLNMRRTCLLADVLTANLAFDRKEQRLAANRKMVDYMVKRYRDWVGSGTNIDPVLLPRLAASASASTVYPQQEPAPNRLLDRDSKEWSSI